MPVTALAVGFDPPRMSCMKKVKVLPELTVEAVVVAATLGLGCNDVGSGCGDTTGTGGSSTSFRAEAATVRARNIR